jgi:hypothetical protein
LCWQQAHCQPQQLIRQHLFRPQLPLQLLLFAQLLPEMQH